MLALTSPLSLSVTRKMTRVMGAFAIAISLSSCAPSLGPDGQAHDPIEPVNRAIFAFNDVVDTVVIEPTARLYQAVLPDPIELVIRNFLRNLASPLVLLHDLLQGDLARAQTTFARFLVNSTAGAGGLVDIASATGLSYHSEDAGQTLGRYGVEGGAYLVLPLLGPSTLRDTAGRIIDYIVNPTAILLQEGDHENFYFATQILTGVDQRVQLLEVVKDLKTNSLDYYAAMRSYYLQNRAAEIVNQQGKAIPEIADFDNATP
jgi:phospholipid-binding lipoprotein MlaA